MKKASHGLVAGLILLLSITWSPVWSQEKSDNIKKKDQSLPPITIMGTISNVSEMEKYISSKTYLQIVQATDGKISMHTVNGELIFKSTLAKIPFPKNGVFVFKKVSNLKLGESYTIASQLIDNSTNRSMWLIMDGKPLKVDFPIDYKYATDTKEIKIDLTKNDIKFSP
jgi:hypothetical protein